MRVIILTLAAAAILAGCGGNNTTSPSQAGQGTQSTGLIAAWRATRAEFVSRSNAALRVEVIAQGSAITLKLDAGGSYTQTITDPGHSPNVTTGSWSSSVDVLRLTPSGMPFSIEFDMSLSGNTLTLTGGSVEFDFNADGSMEEARLSLVLARQ